MAKKKAPPKTSALLLGLKTKAESERNATRRASDQDYFDGQIDAYGKAADYVKSAEARGDLGMLRAKQKLLTMFLFGFVLGIPFTVGLLYVFLLIYNTF